MHKKRHTKRASRSTGKEVIAFEPTRGLGIEARDHEVVNGPEGEHRVAR